MKNRKNPRIKMLEIHEFLRSRINRKYIKFEDTWIKNL